MPAPTPIPLTLITGFLGAGKTTLLNRILQHKSNLRLAVIVNDFGSINIDSHLLRQYNVELVPLENGCICCTLREAFIDALQTLAQQTPPPDAILVEAGGVSDPQQIVLAMNRSGIRNRIQIDNVVTLVDLEQVAHLDDKEKRLAERQVKLASVVVLNKEDLIERLQIATWRKWAQDLAPTAEIVKAERANIDIDDLLHIGAYNPQTAFDTSGHGFHVYDADEAHQHEHSDHSLVFSTWTWETAEKISLSALRDVLSTLPLRVFRLKGVLYTLEQPDCQLVLHVVGKRITIEKGGAWDGDAPQTQIVVVGDRGALDTTFLQTAFESLFTPGADPAATDFTGDSIYWTRGGDN